MATDLFGFTVYFPVTVLTNILLGMVCIFQYNLLKKEGIKWWPFFFLNLGIATFLAAYGHGYSMDLGNPVLFISRVFSIISVLFAIVGSVHYLPKHKWNTWIIRLAILQTVLFIIWLVLENLFHPVKYHAMLGLGLVVASIHLYRIKAGLGKGNAWVLLGITIISLAAVVQGLKISISKEWFNHNDIGHLVMIFGLAFMVRGVKNIATP